MPLQSLPWQHLFLRLPGQPGKCITRRRERLRLQGPPRLRCGGTGLPVRQRASLGLSETRGDVPLLLSALLLILTLAGCTSPPKEGVGRLGPVESGMLMNGASDTAGCSSVVYPAVG